MSRVLLGVAGGIAAYKACELLRRLRDDGHDVTVVPTESALTFVGRATWEALSGHPVSTDVWTDAYEVPHVRLGREADLVVVAPATADLLARAATGRADDLLTNVLLTATCPLVLAPAMHTEMWQHPATRANVATLRSRGAVVVDPAVGRLTGADSGPGRLPEPAEILAVARTVLAEPGVVPAAAAQDLAGLEVAVSVGGTREHLDPVRFLGNSSSGRMGWALARAARLRGAQVHAVVGHTDVAGPPAVEVERVGSTAELATAMTRAAKTADVVVMAAAPADFTPRGSSETKIKKSGDAGLSVELVQTPDVLRGLVEARQDPDQVIVGFAAETAVDQAQLVDLGRAKLARKGCDLLVLNAVGHGLVFGQEDNEITVLSRDDDGATLVDGPYAGSKDVLAHRILDRALTHRRRDTVQR
ncbi:bifunctional phosphopantothenoylcysteine decarboxylase/phosphopantothenate--cysteine ligase CoaBC [Microlunatus flavus]|uniref:Coenzyme A biosynthesis bifunctional protein CoaBC n=1 Tax=Microlunatus flavus TaxID=1036181 RepID=A0A1H9FHU2_9ACTN|nr:bifunctional phosphopantothenoylcysteine decarboxylase/phosphopantothenate--cysteine ligase CoaBC [Microlunatus flavus]SEQ37486.1 phosphopantothenoylcysteine decarboxylase / phosphopantothenate--cysteine ligase [Microlunatus flavus]